MSCHAKDLADCAKSSSSFAATSIHSWMRYWCFTWTRNFCQFMQHVCFTVWMLFTITRLSVSSVPADIFVFFCWRNLSTKLEWVTIGRLADQLLLLLLVVLLLLLLLVGFTWTLRAHFYSMMPKQLVLDLKVLSRLCRRSTTRSDSLKYTDVANSLRVDTQADT